jgi:hypothetical protein
VGEFVTFGIDVAGYQAGIDLVRAKGEGVQFVIAKASGFNVSPLYVAGGYTDHIDRAIAAGFEQAKGHYYLIGGGQEWKTPTEQARWFVAKLYRFNILTDVLMLDNEGLDANGYLFDDAEAAEFIREVIALTGIPPKRVWHYAGARDYRALQPWPQLEALGVRFVWAAYGDYPTGQTPDHEPSLQGSIPRYDVHQFTSRSLVAGRSVDGNYSPHPVADLFGRIDVGYSNVNNFIVILADQRDPYVSWANHLARGSAGGVDCVARIGTPIYAPDDCYLANTPNNGTGGNTITLSFAGGWRDQMMHLSAFVLPGAKRRGEVVGYSGDSGSPGAPHVHWHRVDPQGRRQNPWNYFTTSAPAGGTTTPVEDDMPITDAEIAKIAHAVVSYLLNYPAYTNGVSVSQLYKDVHSDTSNLFHATFSGGPSMKDGGKSISQSLAEINAKPAGTTGGVINTQVSDTDVAKIANATRAKFKSEPLA